MPEAIAGAPAAMRNGGGLRRAARALARWYPVAVVLIAWELLSRSSLVSHRLVPGLGDIGQALMANIANGDLPFHASISLGRALAGFGMAVAAGLVLGVLMARVRWFERLVEPIFSFGYPVPKIALYPIFIFVFGLGSLSKIALVFLECLYPITVNTCYGIQSVDRKHLWSARNMGASRTQIFWRVLLPSAGPSIFSGLRVALPISLIVVIVTEMIGESRGLGYYISYATASFEFAAAYAGVLTIATLGFVLDRLLVFARNRIIFWERLSSAYG